MALADVELRTLLNIGIERNPSLTLGNHVVILRLMAMRQSFLKTGQISLEDQELLASLFNHPSKENQIYSNAVLNWTATQTLNVDQLVVLLTSQQTPAQFKIRLLQRLDLNRQELKLLQFRLLNAQVLQQAEADRPAFLAILPVVLLQQWLAALKVLQQQSYSEEIRKLKKQLQIFISQASREEQVNQSRTNRDKAAQKAKDNLNRFNLQIILLYLFNMQRLANVLKMLRAVGETVEPARAFAIAQAMQLTPENTAKAENLLDRLAKGLLSSDSVYDFFNSLALDKRATVLANTNIANKASILNLLYSSSNQQRQSQYQQMARQLFLSIGGLLLHTLTPTQANNQNQLIAYAAAHDATLHPMELASHAEPQASVLHTLHERGHTDSAQHLFSILSPARRQQILAHSQRLQHAAEVMFNKVHERLEFASQQASTSNVIHEITEDRLTRLANQASVPSPFNQQLDPLQLRPARNGRRVQQEYDDYTLPPKDNALPEYKP